jgi:hypothetical protein
MKSQVRLVKDWTPSGAGMMHTALRAVQFLPQDLMKTLFTEVGKAFVVIVVTTIITWVLSPHAPPLDELFSLGTLLP